MLYLGGVDMRSGKDALFSYTADRFKWLFGNRCIIKQGIIVWLQYPTKHFVK